MNSSIGLEEKNLNYAEQQNGKNSGQERAIIDLDDLTTHFTSGNFDYAVEAARV